MAQCPECGVEIEMPEDCFVGEIVDCEACGAELRVVSCDPVVLEPFEEEEK